MEFFNSLIKDIFLLLEPLVRKDFLPSELDLWQDVGYSQVILQRDTAFELDGTGFNLITSSAIEEGITVIGDDLPDIEGKRKFARISVVHIENEDDEQKAYNLIRKIEYVKYHHFPKGYMIRTSSRSHKEAVRVSKTAVKNGISFQKIGTLLIKKYKEIPNVRSVRVFFITDNSADYSAIENLAQKNNSITETLNHVMHNVTFDCDTCNLKSICDEVDGMKELHFKNSVQKD